MSSGPRRAAEVAGQVETVDRITRGLRDNCLVRPSSHHLEGGGIKDSISSRAVQQRDRPSWWQ